MSATPKSFLKGEIKREFEFQFTFSEIPRSSDSDGELENGENISSPHDGDVAIVFMKCGEKSTEVLFVLKENAFVCVKSILELESQESSVERDKRLLKVLQDEERMDYLRQYVARNYLDLAADKKQALSVLCSILEDDNVQVRIRDFVGGVLISQSFYGNAPDKLKALTWENALNVVRSTKNKQALEICLMQSLGISTSIKKNSSAVADLRQAITFRLQNDAILKADPQLSEIATELLKELNGDSP